LAAWSINCSDGTTASAKCRSTAPGDEAKLYLRQPELDARVGADETVVARQRHLQPAAEGRAVDHRRRRYRQVFQRVEDAEPEGDEFLRLVGVRAGQRLEEVQVRPGDEGARLAAGDDNAGDVGPLQRPQRHFEVAPELVRQDVGPRPRLVQDDDGDPIRAGFDADGGFGHGGAPGVTADYTAIPSGSTAPIPRGAGGSRDTGPPRRPG
jgi:hypothetical protein